MQYFLMHLDLSSICIFGYDPQKCSKNVGTVMVGALVLLLFHTSKRVDLFLQIVLILNITALFSFPTHRKKGKKIGNRGLP